MIHHKDIIEARRHRAKPRGTAVAYNNEEIRTAFSSYLPERAGVLPARADQPFLVFQHRNIARPMESPLVLASFGTIPSAPLSEPGVISGTREPGTLPRRMRVSLVTSFPPSRGDLNEYGYHLACAMREDLRVELTILADDAHSQEELAGFHVQRCWRFNSISNPARLLRAIVK